MTKVKFVLECMINKQMSVLKEAYNELSLLQYQILHFEGMNPIYQNMVIRDLRKKMELNDFYEGMILDEVEE